MRGRSRQVHADRAVLQRPLLWEKKRLSAELVKAGYTHVRRYRLEIPVWRALGGLSEIELEGLRYVLAGDRTAVFIDARDPEEFRAQGRPRGPESAAERPEVRQGRRRSENCKGRWAVADGGPQHPHHCVRPGRGAGQGRDGSHCAGSLPQSGLLRRHLRSLGPTGRGEVARHPVVRMSVQGGGPASPGGARPSRASPSSHLAKVGMAGSSTRPSAYMLPSFTSRSPLSTVFGFT